MVEPTNPAEDNVNPEQPQEQEQLGEEEEMTTLQDKPAVETQYRIAQEQDGTWMVYGTRRDGVERPDADFPTEQECHDWIAYQKRLREMEPVMQEQLAQLIQSLAEQFNVPPDDVKFYMECGISMGKVG